jgi:hypothetical protein
MKTTCLLLIGLLCASTVHAQEPQPKSVAVPCIVGGAILVGGVWVAWEIKKLCDRVLPPCTNNCVPPPPSTNAPPSKPPQRTNNTPRLALAGAAVQAWSFDGATCEKDPAGNDYVAMLSGRFQTSTNLSDWGDLCSFTGWVSPAYVLTIWTGADGVPISTNCDLIGTDVSVALPALSGLRRFFK